jgi:hypothetical protein
MPLLLWLDIFDGATFWRASANSCRAREEGENWTVECARALEGLTGTTVQVESSTDVEGVQGDIATWTSEVFGDPFSFS